MRNSFKVICICILWTLLVIEPLLVEVGLLWYDGLLLCISGATWTRSTWKISNSILHVDRLWKSAQEISRVKPTQATCTRCMFAGLLLEIVALSIVCSFQFVCSYSFCLSPESCLSFDSLLHICAVNSIICSWLPSVHLKEHPGHKNALMRCWHGYLTGVGVNDVHMVQLMTLPPHFL